MGVGYRIWLCKFCSEEIVLAEVFSHKMKGTQIEVDVPNLTECMQEIFTQPPPLYTLLYSASFSFLSAALLPFFLSVNKMWLDL